MTAIQQAAGALMHSRLIIFSTGSLVASWLVNSLLGFFFWFVATRSFSVEAVGLASATVSASMLIGRLTVTGLGTSLAGFLPTFAGDRGALVATAMLVAGAIGAVLAFGFAVVAPVLWSEYTPLVHVPAYLLLFMLGVGLTSVGVVLDQILVSLHRHDLQLARNIVFAASKLVLLALAAVAFDPTAAIVIFGVWALGDAISLLGLTAYVRSRIPTRGVSFQWLVVVSLARNAVGHHAISAARTGPALFMPVLVTGVLSASANAAFYVALIITTALQVIASSASFTLYAVGAESATDLRHQLRVTLGLSLAIVTVGFIALILVGPWLLGLFGEAYVAAAASSLPWMAAMAFPLVIIDHWIALRRIRNEMRGTVAILAVSAGLQIGFAWAGALMAGMVGLAQGWLLALVLTALVMVKEVAQAALASDPARFFARVDGLSRPVPVMAVGADALASAGAAATTVTTAAMAEPPVKVVLPEPTTHISIFIPVRNDANWLPGALESVLAQTHEHWDLVVGDNNSTDDVAAVVARYPDPRIRYHRFDDSVEIMENWNRTAALCEGEWMVALAADDRFRPDFLRRVGQTIEAYPIGGARLALVIASCSRIYPDGTSADRLWFGTKPKQAVSDRIYGPGEWLNLCATDGQQPWSIETVVANREIVGESGGLLRPEIGLCADFEMAMRLAAYGNVVYINEELLDFTVRSDSDNPGRFQVNRARGVRDTVSGVAYQNAIHVHDTVRGLSHAERRRVLDAIARSHLQRAAQHRVLPQGKGRSGAFHDVVRAFRWSPGIVLRPSGLAYAAGAILAPRFVLEYAKEQVSARLHRDADAADAAAAATADAAAIADADRIADAARIGDEVALVIDEVP